MDSGNINAKILKAAGFVLMANNYAEEAINYYEESLSWEKDSSVELYIGIAYYKTAFERGKKSYYQKALKYLKEVAKEKKPLAARANYYLALTYAHLGDRDEASKAFTIFAESPLADTDSVIVDIDSFIAQKADEAKKMENIYQYFDDPIMVDVYNIIYKYVEGSDIERKYMKKYYLEGEEAVAKALEDTFEDINDNTEFRDKPPLQKYVAMLILFLRGNRKGKVYLDALAKYGISNKFIKKLPVFTKAIVLAFIKKFGGAMEDEVRDLPYLLTNLFKTIKALIGLYKKFIVGGKFAQRKTIELLKSLKRITNDKEISLAIKELEKKRVYRLDIKQVYIRSIKIGMRALYERTQLFFNDEKAMNIMKLLISDTQLSEDEKVNLYLMLG